MTTVDAYVNEETFRIAVLTFGTYDGVVYITFAFKPFVIIFFIYNFYKKTPNFKNVFYYLLFIGFCIDFIAWVLVIIDGFCWDYSKNASTQCWYIDIVFTPYSHYNNTFSGFWMLLLSLNRLTAILWWSEYTSLWTRLYKPSIIFILFSPFTVIGYAFLNYKCMFYFGCNDKDFWVKLGTVTAIANGTIAALTVVTAIITSLIYRYKHKKHMISNYTHPDVRLIFQAGVTSVVYLIHYIFYLIASSYRAYKDKHSEYKFDIKYVIIYVIQFLAYPGYHFSAFFFLFVFSSQLRQQFIEFYHLTWIYKLRRTNYSVATVAPTDTLAPMNASFSAQP